MFKKTLPEETKKMFMNAASFSAMCELMKSTEGKVGGWI